MKKNIIAVSVAAAALAFSAAASAGEAGTPYIGGHLGFAHGAWSDSNESLYNMDDSSGTGIGLFLGYNFTENFAVELGYNFFDRFKTANKLSGAKSDLDVQGPELAARVNFPVSDALEFYLRGGLMYANSEISGGPDGSQMSPLAGLGMQFNIDRNIGVRVGYDRYFNAWDGDGTAEGTDMDVDSVYLGFQYTFGADEPAPAPAPVSKSVTTTYNLDANTLFGFDSSVLSAEGSEAVAQVVSESRDNRLENAQFVVAGYTDPLGADAYNQKLSERRAKVVADELVAKGIAVDSITYEGRGESTAVTGNKCDGLKGNAKIECLAPERRVEINVSGTVTTVEEVQ